jgi:hypothetical protein
MTAARESGSPRAPATAALGAIFLLAGLGFHLIAAVVCGIALLGLAMGAVIWVELATAGGRLERQPGPGRLEESEPYPLRILLRRTLVPPPGGELIDTLIDRSVARGDGGWTRPASSFVTRSASGSASSTPAGPRSWWCFHESTPFAGWARAPSRGGSPPARATRATRHPGGVAWRNSRSMGCGPTVTEAPRAGFTGQPWRARAR